ncbi:MAG: hypothetical protein NZ934_02975, partial [Hadesarchaea archaeon]|nr:hypothetical protein [Hadesarchaea archaeon]
MARRLAIRLFGRWTQGKRYDALREKLSRARMAVSADAYVAQAILYSVLVSVAVAASGSLAVWLLYSLGPLTVGLVLLVAALLGYLTYRLFMFYPSLAANERAHEIDLALPHAASFMHALSRSGATVTDIFRELSTRQDMGKIAEEARVFMRDVELLGQDPLTA